MFESLGEVVVLGLMTVVTWMTAWAIAERRTLHTIAVTYRVEAVRSRRRIADLESRLAVRPVDAGDFSARPDTDTPDDPVLAAIA